MEKLKSFRPSADDPIDDNLAPFKNEFSKKISEGSFADIYELTGQGNKETEYLVKAGKTERYPPPILKWLKINLPREKVSKWLVKIFGPQLKIQPDMEFIKNGLAEYLLIKKYFGAAMDRDSDLEESDPRSGVIDEISHGDSDFSRALAEAVGGKEAVAKIAEVMAKNRDYSFLPKEHLVVGYPPSLSRDRAEKMRAEGERLPMTYYIVQERIRGDGVIQLGDLDDEVLSQHPEIIEKLLTLLVLAKKMYVDTGKLIDTRPEEVGKNPFEWFSKTGNILVDKNNGRVSFVDTRWLWDEESRLGKKGVNLIKLLGVRSIDRSIKKYTSILEQSK